MIKQELGHLLRIHDWTYQHSEDPRALRQGRQEAARLRALFAELAPPFTLSQAKAWAQGLRADEFIRAESSTAERVWFHRPGDVLPAPLYQASELIPAHLAEEIQRWFDD